MRKRTRRSSKAVATLCLMLAVLLAGGSMTANGASAAQDESGANIVVSSAEPGMPDTIPESGAALETTPESNEEVAEPPSPGIPPEESAAPEESEAPDEDSENESGEETEDAEEYVNSISGMLWLDVYGDAENGIFAGDGIRQATESPLAGNDVYLYAENDMATAVQTATTDEGGGYRFENFDPGRYVAGVATTVTDGVEYLLPLYYLDGTQGDNRFVAAYDSGADAYLYAYTAVMEISADTVVSGMDAGDAHTAGQTNDGGLDCIRGYGRELCVLTFNNLSYILAQWRGELRCYHVKHWQ